MLVSVIIPTYNVAYYLSECIESVLSQTYKEYEIIIVDNNSIDETLEVAEKYKTQYPTLITIFKEKRQGAAIARNTGLKYAKGDWIQFLDADDIMLNNKLEVQLKLIEQNIAFIVGAWIYLNTDLIKDFHYVKESDIIKSVFKGSNCGQTSANLWNKAYLNRIGGFDESVPDTNDYELMLRLALLTDKVTHCKEFLTIVRDRADYSNLSQKDVIGHYKRHILLRINIIERLKYEKKEYYSENKDFLWHCVYWYCRLLSSYNKNEGVMRYEEVMPSNFKPKFITEIDNPRWHIFFTRVLGFRKTEFLKFWFGRLFPK